MGRRRPEGRWEPPPPIQPHGRPCEVGPRAFCRIRRTICQNGQPAVRVLLVIPVASTRSSKRALSEGHASTCIKKLRISTGYSTKSLLAHIDTALSPIDTALTSPLGGSWAQQLAALTPSRAAKPYRWQHGQAAHTATHRVNVRIGGLRQPPNRPPCTRRVIINLLETPRHHFHCTQHSFRASHVIHSCHNSQSVIHRHQRKAGSHGLFSSIPSP